MDTKELKKLLKGSTAVLILDDGEPSFVILGYDSYKNLLSESEKDKDREKEIRVNQIKSFAQNKVSDLKENQDIYTPKGTHVGSEGKFQNRISEKETELLEKINKEILALKDEIEKEEKNTNNSHVD